MATLPLRERKKLRTRQAIFDTALRLFADRGFDAVTVEEIADAAEVAPRTFFRYFASKEDVVFAEDDQVRRLLVDVLADRSPDEPMEKVLGAVSTTLMEWFLHAPELKRVRQELIAATPRLRARSLAKRAAIEDLIAAHLADNLGVDVHADARPRLWASIGLACWETACQLWLHYGGSLDDQLASCYDALRQLPLADRTVAADADRGVRRDGVG